MIAYDDMKIETTEDGPFMAHKVTLRRADYVKADAARRDVVVQSGARRGRRHRGAVSLRAVVGRAVL